MRGIAIDPTMLLRATCKRNHRFNADRYLPCQAPRPPAAAMTEYIVITPTSSNLKALCPECTGIMYRRIKEADQARFSSELVVATPQALPRLSECTDLSLNVHS